MSEQTVSDEPLVYSGLKPLAAALGLSHRRTWELVNAGQIRCVRVGRRLLFRRESVVEWLCANERAGRR